ncbi:MAG: DNA polymerase III subunit delta [Bacteroidaceae bacterium]|nr:DNA polymerase III subunit delta [Bacteroidaceae bacterium]
MSQQETVVGQQALRQRLRADIVSGRVPHALMFTGPEGAGKLAVAVELARTLLCQHLSPEGEACGVCTSCRMAAKLEHPDLHFAFPIVRGTRIKDAKDATSDHYIKEWRARVLTSPYFDLNDWLSDMGAENQQAAYYVAEADNIRRKLMLKSNQGGRKVMVIWLPEKMNAETANALLKLFEEPPAGTHFIMVSQEADLVLPTILSRTQRMLVPPLTPEEHREAHPPKDESLHMELFIELMRLAYQRKVGDLREWSERLAAMGREPQKAFLGFCQRMVRENFIYNFRLPQLLTLTPEQEAFSRNFARFINERNVIPLTGELTRAQNEITQNVNPRMVFFDLTLKVIVLLKQ